VILRCGAFVDQYLVKHEFVKRLHRRYGAEGIEIPFPIGRVHLSGPTGRRKGKTGRGLGNCDWFTRPGKYRRRRFLQSYTVSSG
jgi:hypothetical protein